MTADLEPRIKSHPLDIVANKETTFEAVMRGESGVENQYGWVFRDDGGEVLGTDTGQTTSWTFSETGTYEIDLTVVDPDGNVANRTTTRYVEKQGNEKPKARILTIPPINVVGQEVTFDASKSEDPDGTITSYEWEFKTDTEDREQVGSATGKRVQHTFSEPGKYIVQLSVEDDSYDGGYMENLITIRDA